MRQRIAAGLFNLAGDVLSIREPPADEICQSVVSDPVMRSARVTADRCLDLVHLPAKPLESVPGDLFSDAAR